MTGRPSAGIHVWTVNGHFMYDGDVSGQAKAATVVGYTRVSTDEQAGSGLGLAAQRTVIDDECRRRGWNLLRVCEDAGASAKSLVGRPALAQALVTLRVHDADALVVAKLDRLSRSLLDFAGLMEQSRREGWSLVILDLGVDTTTPSGEMIANVMATFAQFERRLISQRTTEALAMKRRAGARLGRPVTLDDATVARIHRERQEGRSLRAIAEALNLDGVATGHGGAQWYASTVNAVLRRTA